MSFRNLIRVWIDLICVYTFSQVWFDLIPLLCCTTPQGKFDNEAVAMTAIVMTLLGRVGLPSPWWFAAGVGVPRFVKDITPKIRGCSISMMLIIQLWLQMMVIMEYLGNILGCWMFGHFAGHSYSKPWTEWFRCCWKGAFQPFRDEKRWNECIVGRCTAWFVFFFRAALEVRYLHSGCQVAKESDLFRRKWSLHS